MPGRRGYSSRVYVFSVSSKSKKLGNDMPTQDGSLIVTGPSENKPATAKAIAIRWSPKESISPPRNV